MSQHVHAHAGRDGRVRVTCSSHRVSFDRQLMRQPEYIQIFDDKRIVAIEVLDASQRTTLKPLDLTDLAIVKSTGSDAVRESGETYRRREKAKSKGPRPHSS